jgi:hypothetical protein
MPRLFRRLASLGLGLLIIGATVAVHDRAVADGPPAPGVKWDNIGLGVWQQGTVADGPPAPGVKWDNISQGTTQELVADVPPPPGGKWNDVTW